MSTPGNLLNGKTLSLTRIVLSDNFLFDAEFVQRFADHDDAARRASGTPVALETKGMVRRLAARVRFEDVDGRAASSTLIAAGP